MWESCQPYLTHHFSFLLVSLRQPKTQVLDRLASFLPSFSLQLQFTFIYVEAAKDLSIRHLLRGCRKSHCWIFQNFLLHTSLVTFCIYTLTRGGPGSSVGIATDYGLDGPGSNPGGDEIFRPSRPALGPTQAPVKWVPGLSPGMKCGRGVLLTTHPLLVPRSRKSRAIPLPTLWVTSGL